MACTAPELLPDVGPLCGQCDNNSVVECDDAGLPTGETTRCRNGFRCAAEIEIPQCVEASALPCEPDSGAETDCGVDAPGDATFQKCNPRTGYFATTRCDDRP